MSVVVNTMGSQQRDSRRFLTALLAAVLLHILFFAALAIVRLAENPTPPPVSVELAPGTLGGLAFAGPPSSQASQPAQAQPERAQTSAARTGSGQEFVIPSPRQGNPEGTQPTGPAFRTQSSSNFRTSGAPPATSPVQEPVFPASRPSQQGTTAPSRSGTNQAPARGVGVLVEGGGQAPAQGSLDLGSLDKSGAGVQGTGTQPNGEAGGGGGGGGVSAGPGGGGQGGYRFQWDQPAAAQARKLLSAPRPNIPLWVSKEGLSLTVLVAFTLTPDGILKDVSVEASSGYNDVDAAVSDAVRHWRFSANPSARPVHGLIPYVIRAR